MVNWRIWRWIVIAVLGATAFFTLGLSSIVDMTLQSELLKGVTIQTILGIASLLGIYALWKQL